MPLSSDKKKEYQREYMKQKRSNTGLTEPAIMLDPIAKMLDPNVRPYSALLEWLIDPVKRDKLERIYQQLKIHRVDKDVMFGVGGIPFDIVGECLECTR